MGATGSLGHDDMPDNQTTERDQDVVSYTTFSGLRNNVPSERYSQADLEVANNVDMDSSGELSRRDGYTSVITGASHSLWSNPSGTIGLFAQGNVLYSLTPQYQKQQLAVLIASTPISFFEVNETVYFSNGVDTGIIEQGAARSWGVVPPTLPSVTVGVGQMPAGTYQVTMTYLRATGQESGAAVPLLIQVPEGSSLQFSSLPVSLDPGVVAKNIYISPPNGEQTFQAMLLANNVRFAAYGNGTTELAVPLEALFLVPPPPGQLVSYYRGRMYVAMGDVLCASNPFDYERFDPRNYVQLDGRITMLGPVIDKELYDSGKNSGFFIGTDKTCGVLIGGSNEEFQYVPKASYGAVPGTMALVDGSLFQDGSASMRELPVWTTTQGICVGMPDLTVKNLTRTRYTFPVGQQGAAIFMPDPNRYIATSTI